MNFFEQQDRAKRNTGRLVLLMALAVSSLIALTTLAVVLVLGTADATSGLAILDPALVGGIALVVITVVLLGGLYKRLQLNKGGSAVAELLGGRLINLDPQDADERKILNVVEEMAIASGTPVPPVYVLEDAGINAFAAGLTRQDAVIGITRGCIHLLSRDELQGVVAHEFSHIFHGDMRLNTRLVALLHGILVIGLIGEMVLRGSSQRSSSSRSSKDNSGLVVLLLGAALMLIGYAGTFFGNLIKAAVSRQREFLADASAVQFTRNPLGIGGALKKIGGHAQGSRLQAPHAAQFSHMFFGQGIASAFGSLMATHPPLAERIRRVEPGWDGAFVSTDPSGSPAPAPEPEVGTAQSVDGALGSLLGAGFATLTGTPYQAEPAASAGGRQAAAEAIAAIGAPGLPHLIHARQSLGLLDPQLNQAAHSPLGAQALMFGLLLSEETAPRERQLALVQSQAGQAYPLLLGLQDKLLALRPRLRLPLVELALPALKQLSAQQRGAFKAGLVALIRADRNVSLREWALYRILRHNLESPALVPRYVALEQLPGETALLLSVLAYAGHQTDEQAYAAFLAAGVQLPFGALLLAQVSTLDIEGLDAAVNRLSQLKPLHKPRLLKALARCIEHDEHISVEEAELFRALADSLDCPMPPLLLAETHPPAHYRPA